MDLHSLHGVGRAADRKRIDIFAKEKLRGGIWVNLPPSPKKRVKSVVKRNTKNIPLEIN